MTAKEWLSRGFWLKKEKEQLDRLRAETFTRLTKVTQTVNGDPVQGTKDPYKFDALVQLDVDIEEKQKALDKTRLEIFEAIQQLPDRRYRMVLLGRYYEGLSWEEIVPLLHYEIRQVYRLHGMALVAIEPIIRGLISKKKETVV